MMRDYSACTNVLCAQLDRLIRASGTRNEPAARNGSSMADPLDPNWYGRIRVIAYAGCVDGEQLLKGQLARGPNKGFVDAPARSIFDRALVNIAPGIMKRYARPHTAAAPSNGRDDLTMPAWVWAWLEIWLCMCQTGIDSVRDQVFRAYERNVYPSRAVIRDGEITFEKNSAQDRLLAEAVARQTQIDLDFIKAQDALHALEFALADGYNKDAFMSLLYLGEHSQAGTVVWLIQGGLLPLFVVQGCPMHAIERGGQVTLEFERETAQIPRITR